MWHEPRPGHIPRRPSREAPHRTECAAGSATLGAHLMAERHQPITSRGSGRGRGEEEGVLWTIPPLERRRRWPPLEGDYPLMPPGSLLPLNSGPFPTLWLPGRPLASACQATKGSWPVQMIAGRALASFRGWRSTEQGICTDTEVNPRPLVPGRAVVEHGGVPARAVLGYGTPR